MKFEGIEMNKLTAEIKKSEADRFLVLVRDEYDLIISMVWGNDYTVHTVGEYFNIEVLNPGIGHATLYVDDYVCLTGGKLI